MSDSPTRRVRAARVASGCLLSRMPATDALFAKQGPLAKVWLAAHWERKLSKTQLLQTSIPTSVETIVGDDDDDAPVALRLSGQLLLGIARIYSRKAKYLEDDCNDALLRIQVAFRSASAVVDLSHDQLHLSRTAITLPDTLTAADLFMPEPVWANAALPDAAARSKHMARPADITLPDATLDALDQDIPHGSDALLAGPLPELDTSAHFDLGLEDESMHPPAKRAREWKPRGSARRSSARPNADLSLPDIDADDSFASVGVGRDAGAPIVDAAEHVRALVGDVDLSMDFSMDSGMAPMELEAPMHASTPPRERATTPLHDVTFEQAIAANAQLTPRTAAKLRSAALLRVESALQKGPRKRPVQDRVTDIGRSHVLQVRSAAATMSTSPHELRCLPATRAELALLTAPKNAARDVQQTLSMTWGAVVPRIDSALQAAMQLTARKQRVDLLAPHQDKQHWLRQVHEQAARQNVDDEYPHEVGRRQSDAPWLTDEARFADLSSETMRSAADTTAGEKTLPPADFTLGDLPELPPLNDRPEPPAPRPEPMDVEEPELRRSTRRRDTGALDAPGGLPELRLGTPEAEETEWHAAPVSDAQPLAAFESRAQEQPKDASLAAWDASTLQAMHVLRSTMNDEQASFQRLSHNASRRAAAGFFFEMLVLGTKDCVRLRQDEPYGDVQIEAKPALYTSP